MSDNWVTGAYAELDTLKQVVNDLDNLSYIMGEAGNEKISKEIRTAYVTMAASILKLQQIVSNKTDADLKQANQNAANLLQAALAGARSAEICNETKEK